MDFDFPRIKSISMNIAILQTITHIVYSFCQSVRVHMCIFPAVFTEPFFLHISPSHWPLLLSTSSSAELLSPVRLNLMETLHLGLSVPRSFTLYRVHLWVSWIHLVLSIVEGDYLHPVYRHSDWLELFAEEIFQVCISGFFLINPMSYNQVPRCVCVCCCCCVSVHD